MKPRIIDCLVKIVPKKIFSGLKSEKKTHLNVYSDEKIEEYSKRIDRLKNEYKNTPFLVSVETFALCNAKCEFCPTHQLERKGQKISEDLFVRILQDLSEIEEEKQPLFVLSRVNEPFLDTRIFHFMRLVNEYLPGSRHLIFTNGSLLGGNKLEELLEIDHVGLLNVSLNASNAADYKRVMSLDFNKTIRNLEKIHFCIESRKITYPVRISRVADGSDKDIEFINFVNRKFPLFETNLMSRVNWLGKVTNDNIPEFVVPDIGCTQWFEMHILSNGKTSFCCIDSTGELGLGGDVVEDNILDMYNSSSRLKLRLQNATRKNHYLCQKCSLLS